MKRGRLGRLVWPGMVLAGLGLGLAVLAAWPEPTTRIVRLPYGEAQPKTPLEAAPAPAARQVAVAPRTVTQPREPAREPAAVVQPDEVRVLAAIEPEPDLSAGPPPVPSELEESGGFEQESPEELGAAPLPGADPTPAEPTPAPVAG